MSQKKGSWHFDIISERVMIYNMSEIKQMYIIMEIGVKHYLTILYKISTLLDMLSIYLGQRLLNLGHLRSFTESSLLQCNSNFRCINSLLHCYRFSPEQYHLLFLAPSDVSIAFLKIIFFFANAILCIIAPNCIFKMHAVNI